MFAGFCNFYTTQANACHLAGDTDAARGFSVYFRQINHAFLPKEINNLPDAVRMSTRIRHRRQYFQNYRQDAGNLRHNPTNSHLWQPNQQGWYMFAIECSKLHVTNAAIGKTIAKTFETASLAMVDMIIASSTSILQARPLKMPP